MSGGVTFRPVWDGKEAQDARVSFRSSWSLFLHTLALEKTFALEI